MSNGMPTHNSSFTAAKNPHGEHYFREINSTLFENSSANEIFSNHFGGDLFQEDTFYIFIGSDSGLLSRYIFQHSGARGSRYLFIEPNEVMSALTEAAAIQRAPGIKFSPLENWLEHAQKLGIDAYAYTRKIRLINSTSAAWAIYHKYSQLIQQISEELGQYQWERNLETAHHLFIYNNLANLADNQVPASIFKGAFEGKAAVIMAAGPSLDSLLPWIKSHREQVVLIAVSRIARVLLANHLTPDIVANADPQQINFSLSKDIFELGPGVMLLNNNTSTPSIVSQWPHKKAYLGPQYYWEDDKSTNFPSVGPTVTNAAISFAFHAGCKQIILAGVDLCFSDEELSHSSELINLSKGKFQTVKNRNVKTNSGDIAGTTTQYYESIKTIKEQAEFAHKHGCTIYNLAANAAAIPAVKYCSPEMMTIKLPFALPAKEVINQLFETSEKNNKKEHLKLMAIQVKNILYSLDTIISLTDEAKSHTNDLINNNNNTKQSKKLNKVNKIEHRLENDFSHLGNTIKRINARHFSDSFINESNDNVSLRESLLKTKIYYEAYNKGAELLQKYLENAADRISARLEEEAESPDFNKIFSQWSEDNQPGRSQVWQENHPNLLQQLPPKTLDLLDQIADVFKRQIKYDEHQIQDNFKTAKQIRKSRLDREKNEANEFINIATPHFEKGNQEEILNLAERICNRISPIINDGDKDNPPQLIEEAKRNKKPFCIQLQKLAHGMVNELRGEIRKAHDNYQAIDQQISWELKQFGLERILSTALENENYSVAGDVLELLAEHVDNYKIYYAQLLSSTGKIEESIDQYLSYLENHPDDLNVAEELLRVFINVRARQAANEMLDHIKKANPNHEKIRELSRSIEAME